MPPEWVSFAPATSPFSRNGEEVLETFLLGNLVMFFPSEEMGSEQILENLKLGTCKLVLIANDPNRDSLLWLLRRESGTWIRSGLIQCEATWNETVTKRLGSADITALVDTAPLLYWEIS